MIAWWVNDKSRLKVETKKIEDLQKKSPWLDNIEWSFDNSVRLCVAFDINLDHGRFSLVLTYHNTFPCSPPSVAPIDESRLSSHQYGNGDLCLEIRPDNWRQEFTGANMIESAYALLKLEVPDDEGNTTTAPSAHNVPDTITHRFAHSRFYVTPEVKQALLFDAPDTATARIYVQWTGLDFAVAHLKSLELIDFHWCNESIPAALEAEAHSRKGIVIRTAKCEPNLSVVQTASDLISTLDYDPGFSKEMSFALIVTSDEKLILYVKLSDGDQLYRHQPIFSPTETHRRSGEEFNEVEKIKVGIIGLGSLGSKVAATLARAGLRNFELVDDDILHPGNLERHDADWRDIGVHKVDIVSRRLKLISPDVKVSTRKTSIGAQVSSTEAGNVSAALASCDIIIDATANSHAFNHLAGLSISAEKNLFWAGIYSGGIGGYIARSRSGIDPDPFSVRESLNQYYSTIDTPPPIPDEDGYDGREENVVLTASDADVSIISAHLANLVIDTALKREPSQFEHQIYIIGLKRAWIFDSSFDIRPITVAAVIKEDLSTPDLNPEQQEFLNTLIVKKLNELKDSTPDS